MTLETVNGYDSCALWRFWRIWERCALGQTILTSSYRLLRHGTIPRLKKNIFRCDRPRPSPLLLVPRSYSYSVSFRHYGPILFRHQESLLPVKKRPRNEDEFDGGTIGRLKNGCHRAVTEPCDLSQSTIWTGVRKSTLLKKISAIFPGIRIHPCDAG